MSARIRSGRKKRVKHLKQLEQIAQLAYSDFVNFGNKKCKWGITGRLGRRTVDALLRCISDGFLRIDDIEFYLSPLRVVIEKFIYAGVNSEEFKLCAEVIMDEDMAYSPKYALFLDDLFAEPES